MNNNEVLINVENVSKKFCRKFKRSLWYGVQDMAGNVSEWLADWYDENYYDSLAELAENPSGPDSGERRSIRGGSFGLNASKQRTTNRGSEKPSHYGPYDGFRCVQSVD